jgi:hypothetical protein
MLRRTAAVSLTVTLAGVLALAATGCEPDERERPASQGSAPRAEPAGCPDGFASTMEAWGDVGFDGTIAVVRGPTAA